jgi:hypothetical protein
MTQPMPSTDYSILYDNWKKYEEKCKKGNITPIRFGLYVWQECHKEKLAIAAQLEEEIKFLQGYVGTKCNWDAVAEDCIENLQELIAKLKKVQP